ncbi:MAG: molybdopterin molybdotransferase MoeA [Acidocella sp.]|nr:molybdopterin molybdotransferase MoeA [Acidocella sp.]
MITVDAARARILGALSATGAETVGLGQGWNRVLAAPVYARLTQPPADISAMDGFALRAADAAAGVKLRVIGAAPAGHPFPGVVGPHEAVRLFTGSVMPEGADAVLLQEDATATADGVTVHEAAQAGRHIRRAGQDFALGDLLIAAGRRLSARDIGLAAAGNHAWLAVHRAPRVAIMATGDEISLPGDPVGPGGIVSSNAHALAAFVAQAGGEPVILPIAGDRLEAIAEGADGARGADLLVTTGGASVGAHDLVGAGLAARGMVLDFWKIAMRPGKPLMFGTLGGMPVLGLPGNPVSAFVCAMLFLRPAIDRLSGLPGAAPVLVPGRLGAALKANDQREDYVRATWRDGVATPFAKQDSGMLRNLAHADVLIRRPPHQAALAVGDAVEVLVLG